MSFLVPYAEEIVELDYLCLKMSGVKNYAEPLTKIEFNRLII